MGFTSDLEDSLSSSISVGIEDVKTYISHKNIISSKNDRSGYIRALVKTIIEDPKSDHIWIVYKNQSTLNQIKNITTPFLSF